MKTTDLHVKILLLKFKDFSRPWSVFQVLFKANIIFKDSPVYSSTFQACANHAQAKLHYCSVSPEP